MSVSGPPGTLDGLLPALPVPLFVIRGDRLVFTNTALRTLLGLREDELPSLLELAAHFGPEERSWVEPLCEALMRGEQPTPVRPAWVRVRGADGSQHVLSPVTAPGRVPEEQLVLLLDAEGGDAVRTLSTMLVATAAELLRCRDEGAVLELAVDSLHRQGFYVSVMLLEGDFLRHGPMRQEAESLAAASRLYGQDVHAVRFPRSGMPHLEEVLTSRRAVFHPDAFSMARRLHSPEVADTIQRIYPPGSRALDAPIFVGDEPFGVLAVQSTTLTPANAGALELFAQLIGGALENVRHHRAAEARLAEVSRLQNELIASERLTALGEAAGVVAHEVRNPLGAILNTVAVLKREPRLGPAGASAVEMLEEEAIRLEDIVRDLLDAVRPLEPRPRPVSLGELVHRALAQLLHGREELPKPRVAFDEAPDVPELSGDETLLQLAVTHLMRNAIQASPRGGTVRVEVRRVPEGVSLSAEDEGPGIAGLDPQRVFEPFFLTRANGRGLGLAIVRRVVLAHGGKVRAGARPEGGARFELVLPL
ncbi:GAF domain-containing protein [Corallococcus sp. AB011P]|uniref:sensor histidine kinase n=1 Tax=unclassified Corallococcus TaxID=2685029 RepID=UPI000EA12AEC|nr:MULTISPECIES: ATP-binding protein [unclassified Corallococcus]RKG51593.1 GAF domain-containing protein [Corallococcus sp. AB011P]RKH83680.1 GAF domain-containing protein [Corallococcus sp. AB045]